MIDSTWAFLFGLFMPIIVYFLAIILCILAIKSMRRKINECGFIRIEAKSPNSKPYLNGCTIEDVTFVGYQFAESVREPSIWEKTKSIVGKVGNHTLGFIESVAHNVAVEAGKEAVKIAMWKNS